MANLLATKPLNLLMEEARETGEHSFSAHRVGRERHYWGRHFCDGGARSPVRRPGTHTVVRSLRVGMRICRALLRGVRGHDSTGR